MIKIKCSFATSAGQSKNLSPQRESNPWPPRYQLGALTTELRETLGELGHLLSGSYVTREMHTSLFINLTLSILAVCRTRATYEPSKWQVRVEEGNISQSLSPIFQALWVSLERTLPPGELEHQ